jgi:hypothetical protein
MNELSACSGAEERDAPAPDSELQRLKELAIQRVRHGLALPREVYALPFRNRLDWFQFPPWAWPTDPEVYQDCGHEG